MLIVVNQRSNSVAENKVLNMAIAVVVDVVVVALVMTTQPLPSLLGKCGASKLTVGQSLTLEFTFASEKEKQDNQLGKTRKNN